MNFLDAFYHRTYEAAINKKMLYYDYVFPMKEVEKYVQQIISIPIKQFVQHDIDAETIDSITPKDVFQFSTLEAGTYRVCIVLNNAGNPGATFIQAGRLLLDDGKPRKDVAYIKYGENHLKTAEALGLLYELTHTYFLSCIGVVYLKLSEEDQRRLLTRLFLRNKFIARLIKASATARVDARQFLYMLSDATYVRRKSNIKCILRYLLESKEYDFTKVTDNIYFS